MSEIFIFVALLCLMAITGFSALWANDLLASIIMFSAFSFLLYSLTWSWCAGCCLYRGGHWCCLYYLFHYCS